MIPKINRDFLSQNNINGTGNPCKYIVIHETDNTREGANARTHAAAQHDGNFKDMSVHYYCGSDGIYQAAEHTCKCWHIGRMYVANPNVPACNNNNSIGVEICVNSDGDYNTARNNGIALVRYLLASTGIPARRVIRHYDAKGKYCPRKMMDRPELWNDFKKQILMDVEENSQKPESPDVDTAEHGCSSLWTPVGTAVSSGEGVYYRPKPGTDCTPYGKLGKGNRFEVDGEKQGVWIHAKVRDRICWIHEKYVSYDEPASSGEETTESNPWLSAWNPTGTAVCGGEGVRVRKTPEFGDNILLKLGKGNRFEIDGEVKNGFHHMKTGSVIGWISSKYVQEDN